MADWFIHYPLISLLTPVFELFRLPNVAITLAAAILAVAVALLFWFWVRHVFPMRCSLKRVMQRLQNIQDEAGFNGNFPSIDEAFQSEPLLKHPWEEFKKTLIMPSDASESIRNTQRPAAFLNVATVSGELALPLYQAIPNYFVGVGLLFTFLGLVAALYFASLGVAGDIRQAKSALGDLLTAATFKFSTSIAGLLSSLLLSFFTRIRVLGLQRRFHSLCELLERRLVFVSPEWLALRQFYELEKQTLQLERFNTDFAVELAKVLEDRFATSIGRAVEPMARAIDGMAENFKSLNQDAMTQIVDQFKQSIHGAAGSEINALGETLKNLQLTLRETLDGVDRSGGSFATKMDGIASRMDQLLSSAAEGVQGKVAEAAARLETMLSSVSSTLREDAVSVSTELGRAIAQITNKFENGMDAAAGRWDAQLGASADAMRAKVDAVGESMVSKIDSATERFGSVVEPFATEIHALQNTLHLLDERMRAQLDGFTGTINRMSGLSAELDSSMIRLRDAGAPIAATAEAFGRAARQVEVASDAVRQSQEQLKSIAETIKGGAELVQQSWESYRQRFEKVDVDLSSTFAKLQEGTDAYHRRVVEYVEKIDGHFTSSLKLLAGGIQELKDSVEELTEATEQMSRAPVRG